MSLFIHPRHEDTIIASMPCISNDHNGHHHLVVPLDCTDELIGLGIPYFLTDTLKSYYQYSKAYKTIQEIEGDTSPTPGIRDILVFWRDVAEDQGDREDEIYYINWLLRSGNNVNKPIK